MKNKTFKNILSVCALSLIGTFSLTKANAQEAQNQNYNKPYYFTEKFCKFIDNRSKVVIDYCDTLPVYRVDTMKIALKMNLDSWTIKIACDCGPDKPILVFIPQYYGSWSSPILPKDTVTYNMMKKHDAAIDNYRKYDEAGDEKKRDEAEKQILALRKAMADRSKSLGLSKTR